MEESHEEASESYGVCRGRVRLDSCFHRVQSGCLRDRASRSSSGCGFTKGCRENDDGRNHDQSGSHCPPGSLCCRSRASITTRDVGKLAFNPMLQLVFAPYFPLGGSKPDRIRIDTRSNPDCILIEGNENRMIDLEYLNTNHQPTTERGRHGTVTRLHPAQRERTRTPRPAQRLNPTSSHEAVTVTMILRRKPGGPKMRGLDDFAARHGAAHGDHACEIRQRSWRRTPRSWSRSRPSPSPTV